MVKKLRLSQDTSVAEREQQLAAQTAEARAERLARARARVELFGVGSAGRAGPGATAPAANSAANAAAHAPQISQSQPQSARPRIELFGSSVSSALRASGQDNARTVEEA
jgi:chemotaxis protein CheD